jgi:hypothetical protein
MKAIVGVNLKSWFNENVESQLVFSPTSISPQPVHVLNGFFHAVLTGRRQTRMAADFVATKDGTWQVGQEDLRARADGKLDLPVSDRDLDLLRRAVAAMVATDRAVFSGNHSFQVAHIGLTSSDSIHLGLGTLGAKLVLNDEAASLLLSKGVDRLKQPQSNPHWGLQRALIDDAQLSAWDLDEPSELPGWAYTKPTAALASDLTALLRRSLELLASDCDSLLAIQTVANTVTWAGLMTYAHLPALAVGAGRRALLLECTTPGDLATLRESSSESLIAVHLTFEQWLAHELRSYVRKEFGGDPDDTQAKYFLNTCEPYSLSGGSKAVLEHSGQIYAGYLRSENDSSSALANTLRDLLVTGMGNKHRSWFHAVGRHCGFIGPRRGRQPRLRAETSLLPTLVLAGMPDKPIESLLMSDWLMQLENRFGVAIGPGSLSRRLHPRASEEDLEQNQSELARLLAAVGLGRRYSDGVTEVLDPRTLWVRK